MAKIEWDEPQPEADAQAVLPEPIPTKFDIIADPGLRLANGRKVEAGTKVAELTILVELEPLDIQGNMFNRLRVREQK